jgi:hypothetical protein
VSDPATLLQANRARRRLRRILFLVALPFVIAGLLLGGKLLSMYAFAHQAGSSYAAGEYAATAQAARGQHPLNWFEPYKAPFNLGVGLADGGDLAGARVAFEESLGLAHDIEQCAVRVNLAIVLERTGDAALLAGDRTAATAAWQESLVVLQDAPEGCDTPEANQTSPDPSRDLDETMDEQQERLREKLEDSVDPPGAPEQEQPEQPDGSELDEIQEQLEQGAGERQDRGQGGSGGGGTDRPW